MDNTMLPVALRKGAALANHVRKVEKASSEILELGVELDLELTAEARPAERLRLLRATTNRITRTANEAIEAYRRAQAAASREKLKPGADAAWLDELMRRLAAARAELLRVLAIAAQRYPPSR
jgi:hypothetical protein